MILNTSCNLEKRLLLLKESSVSQHQMVYMLMLLWQHTQFQIAIMQEWLPLYLILSKHCPLPKG